MRRVVGQLSLADGLVEGRSSLLDRLAGVVDWEALERLLAEVHAAPVGRPGYGPVVLRRFLLLQQWYGLSEKERLVPIHDQAVQAVKWWRRLANAHGTRSDKWLCHAVRDGSRPLTRQAALLEIKGAGPVRRLAKS